MRRASTFVAVCVLSTACQFGVEIDDPQPFPVALATEPSVVGGTGATTSVDVIGLGFVSGSEVRWNGEARPTTFVDSTRLTASLSSADVGRPGTASLTVSTPAPGGGESQPLTVTVGYPVPTVSSVSPSSAEAVINSFVDLTVVGTGFATGPEWAVVQWNGVALPTTVVSSTQLVARVGDHLLRRGGTIAITVRNPMPGGRASGTLPFLMLSPVPALTNTTPGGVRVGQGGPVMVSGIGFVYGATVSLGAASVVPDRMSANAIWVTVPGSSSVRGDTIPIRVTNAGPGGGTSNQLLLPVWEHVPRLDALSTRWVYMNSPPFVVGLTGANFAPDASVTWNGQPHAATFVSSTRLDVSVEASEIAVDGAIDLLVVNPRGGGPSSSSRLHVLPPFALPDGEVLTEMFGSAELAVSKLDGGQRQSFPTPEVATRPDPSPVSDTVVYYRNVTEGFDRVTRLFVRDLSSGSERRLLDTSFTSVFDDEGSPAFSADGAWIYFQARERTSRRYGAWRVRPDGSGIARVSTQFADNQQWYPSPSTSGDRIVYSDHDGALKIFVLATAQTIPLGVRGTFSRWAPGDSLIAYLTHNSRLRVIHPDGTQDQEPVPAMAFSGSFDWLPDGRNLLVVTPLGAGAIIDTLVGKLDSLPALGQIGTIAWYRDP